jgi:hypothetical protein
MSNYDKVQFIAWELHTGPVPAPPPAGESGWYSGLCDPGCDGRTGLLGQCWDIEARLAFTADAMARAELLSDRNPFTLKVFMAPELLLRGAGGAYLHALLEGEQGAAPFELALPGPYGRRAGAPFTGGLFGGLRALAAQPAFEHWLFVFGSAAGAAFPGFRRDGKGVFDTGRPGAIEVATLVQRGGPAHTAHCHVARKHYRSGAAWLAWNAWAAQPAQDGLVQDGLTPAALAALAPPEALGEAHSAPQFCIPTLDDGLGSPIAFGIEVGLDHARAGARHVGRLRAAGREVRIQLVPSSGMALAPDSVSLLPWRAQLPSAYVFHCDGMSNLNGTAGCHTQLACAGQGAHAAALLRLVEASGGRAHEGSELVALAEALPTSFGPVCARRLWSNGELGGAGRVRVIAPLAL